MPWKTSWGLAPNGAWPASPEDLTHAVFASGQVALGPGVVVNVFPSWGTDAIWFDVDARDLTSRPAADSLSDVIRALGRTVDRSVLLSYEGRDSELFAAYRPVPDTFEWLD
jgi:hypothetical protein